MNPKIRKANAFRRLASQLLQDIEIAERLAQQTFMFTEDIKQRPGWKDPNIYAVALSLQHFYTAVEAALLRAVNELDGDKPNSENWHRDLLMQASLEIEKVRPQLISKAIQKQLDRFRRFRHIVRHGYEYELEWEQMSPLVDLLKEIFPAIQKELEEFCRFLKESAAEFEKENNG